LLDTVELAMRVRSWETIIFYTPEEARQALRDMVKEPLELIPQSRGDLGARMSQAFRQLFARGHRLAVIIGGDLPTLPLGRLRAAFSALEHKPVVLGPSADGGYYLIGLRAPQPELFEGIAWGTPQVLEQTVDRLNGLGLEAECLEPWYDVDTVEDLRFLASHLRLLMACGSPELPDHTVDCLRQLGLL
jgi:rSAM/selenodomain-associated transferase 1